MHIHNAPSTQYSAFHSTQAIQRAQAARRAAAVVRRKPTSFAASDDEEAVACVAAYAQGERGGRQNQPRGEEEFRSVFVSLSA